ncbi:hypothetical protein J2R80_000576 [Bradyrhizobium sp. USDA 4541]|nr:hypothetical protein [Bradyrhizobium sp. USDA 4541]
MSALAEFIKAKRSLIGIILNDNHNATEAHKNVSYTFDHNPERRLRHRAK